ncbi:hypothetical protein CEUSTIGMA_g12963.t1 [Chlamydomonas eustigma]|uniref:inorganic diphosphatase n=1 Tax=Chlamydomonas eustigma TaxID=1157962 RepID=A0A250XR64_9CHLO|nr:hypothetical protein CEUSTIGMA_g12963.t1 [Chlamydomonas eustigma]|eukprot:GAX85548.1 hypothetical protein CEUSTIGMA_g12963.t1 [Chlamydomonas eustigma]
MLLNNSGPAAMSDEAPKGVVHSVSAVDVTPNCAKSDSESRNTDVIMATEVPEYTTVEEGVHGTLDFRAHFKAGGNIISPWHDIPLRASDGSLHFICEIPKETSAKMEIATKELKNPIKQDVKKGAPRFHPYNINWNYGLLPQTWEDPSVMNPDVQCSGDNDPVDVVEIGSRTCRSGGVYKVKAFGVLAMIDSGELDWKIMTICVDDPKSHLIHELADVEEHFPGTLHSVREWFRNYKTPDGKPPNKFGYNEEYQSREFAEHVIQETSEFYIGLKAGQRPDPSGLVLA